MNRLNLSFSNIRFKYAELGISFSRLRVGRTRVKSLPIKLEMNGEREQIIDELGSSLQTLSVRSHASSKRMAALKINRPSPQSFYSNIGNQNLLDDEEDDSTYEASTESDDDSLDSECSNFPPEMAVELAAPSELVNEMEITDNVNIEHINDDDGNTI